MKSSVQCNNNKKMNCIPEILFALIGGVIGWFVGEFSPTFPLIIVTFVFIFYDAYTAYKLDKRVKLKYPDKAQPLWDCTLYYLSKGKGGEFGFATLCLIRVF